MRILLFLPSSRSAYDILSQALYLQKKEYHVHFLSTSPAGEMHQLCNNYKIDYNSLNIASLNVKSYLSASFKLARFVKTKKIDLIFSNNLQGNFIALIAQKIHQKRTILTRHHSDYIFTGNNKNAKRQQWFVNRFGKEFIAISDKVKERMLIEGIKKDKIFRINLGFDFKLFPSLNITLAKQLEDEFNDSFKICTIARLIPLKRHLLLFESMRKLSDQGENIILWVMGDGPLKNKLKEWINFNRLEKVIRFTGYIENTQDYLAASDLLVHVSESEASSHVIREAALVKTPVLVCKGVGDFEDYIVDETNGFLVEKNSTPKQIADKIIQLSTDKENLAHTAIGLHKTVMERFNINTTGRKLIKTIEDA